MVQKPGFYTGTLVYTISMFAVLACLSMAMYSNADMRKSMGFFTAILTIGTIIILTHIGMRILQAEQAVYGEEDLKKIHNVSLCPDAYKLDETEMTCVPNRRVKLTLGEETIAGYDNVEHKLSATANLETITEGAKLNVEGIKKICDNSDLMSLSYAEFRPLCGKQ
jgi:hypothetical protein